MCRRLRGLAGLTVLLLAFSAPAVAMDPSATEETNCLMACDANQENCMAAGHGAAGKDRAPYSAREMLMSRRLRATANFSQIDRSTPPKERQRQ